MTRLRRFIIVGQTARPELSLDDLPATSGRLDLLLQCARAALLVSHGVRRDTIAYLVMMGAEGGPRTLRIEGPTAQFVRPDERSLALLVQKASARSTGFGDMTRGVSVARGGLEVALADGGARGRRFVLDERAALDLRDAELGDGDVTFVLGDHLGLDEASARALADATRLRVGPVSLHASDAVTIVVNELDRRGLT